MATIHHFRDLEAWKNARKLTNLTYKMSRGAAFSRDFALRDQIRRAAISVMSNIAEGFERDRSGEFVQFLSIAKASAAEVEAQLYIAMDQEYITADEFKISEQLANSTKRLIAGLMKYLRQSDLNGRKFKDVRTTSAKNQRQETQD